MSRQKIFLFLFLFVVVSVFSVQAQMKKKEKSHIWNLGGGVGAGDLGKVGNIGFLSYYGPSVNLNYRKTIIKAGKYMNVSFNLDAFINAAFVDEITETKFSAIPVVAPSFNFNLLEGAYPAGKSRSFIGFFLGAGMMAIPMISLSEVSGQAPDFGPIANAGFRIRPGKGSYFTVKVFGGVTLQNEVSFGGVGITFPLHGRDSKFGSHACKKHSKRVYR